MSDPRSLSIHPANLSPPEAIIAQQREHTPQDVCDSQIDLSKCVHLIPGLARGLTVTYEQVIKDWEEADLSRSLYVCMKDWKPEWHKATGQTQKYGQRQMIALEFIEKYNRDKVLFTTAYPEHARGFTPLLNAIRRARQERGDCEERPTRRKN